MSEPTRAATGRVPPLAHSAPGRAGAPGTSARWWPPGPVTVTGLVAVVLAGAWLAAPPMGTDLSAQVARADFFAAHGWAVLDLRWYAGVSPLGYSLLSPPLMAWFGPRPVGAVAAVVSALTLVLLLRRAGAPRPTLGGVAGAVAFTGNLVSGRITFALGVVLGLLALLSLGNRPSLDSGRPSLGNRPSLDSGRPSLGNRPSLDNCGEVVVQEGALPTTSPQLRRWTGGRLVAAAVLAATTSAASPVAGLFVGLAGVAYALAGRPAPATGSAMRSGRWGRGPAVAGGAALALGAAVPLAATALLFGSGGWMNLNLADTLQAVAVCLLVVLLVPVRPLRVGALLAAAGVAAAYLVTSPVGLNATRLPALFALPLLAAYATVPTSHPRAVPGHPWVVPVLALVAAVLLVPPVVTGDLARAGDPTAGPSHPAPLREELARRQVGRVEVVPTVNYWEAAALGDTWLARGWLRQADTGRHPLFFDGTLTPGTYHRWLREEGVTHVALSDGPLSWVGRAEAELIRAGLPYLTPVWRGDGWTLFEVADAPGLVDGPATVTGRSAAILTVNVDEPADVRIRVRWSRWLAVSGPDGACLAPAGEWTRLHAPAPGVYRVSSSLVAGPRC